MRTAMMFYAVCEVAPDGEWDTCGCMHEDWAAAERDLARYPHGFLVRMTWTRCQPVHGHRAHPVCSLN